jgi:hypothetical protein
MELAEPQFWVCISWVLTAADDSQANVQEELEKRDVSFFASWSR